ncbi:MAG: UDP-N-acetylmuramoyl-L-alanine--D-glutamate ligase [Lysobacterales bacterium]
MRISALENQRVAIWGWGAEGRAAYRAVRSRLPTLPLTLLCSTDEAVVASALGEAALTTETRVDAERLASFNVVIKSPGISPYRDDVRSATAAGTRFIGGTALWFAENPDARTICVTGTKGKSTCTALIAHLLRAGGHRVALAGNIGMPLLDLLDVAEPPAFWAIELSSFQTGDLMESGVRPEIAVVLNIFPEHLDWHGDEIRYVADKLSLVQKARPCFAVLNAHDPVLASLEPEGSELRWFGHTQAWHVHENTICNDTTRVLELDRLALKGQHNGANLCAALTAIDALGLDARALARHAVSFVPLPHRLQWLGAHAGLGFVNDSISTTPHASVAALEVYAGQRVAIIVGGFDRQLDWSPFVTHVAASPPVAVITQGANGPRIHDLLKQQTETQTGTMALAEAEGLEGAIALAISALGSDGIVLLSPGAPSFDAYRDYTERGRDFARLAGFEGAVASGIAGLGIA